MKKIYPILAGIMLCARVHCDAAPRPDQRTRVASQGLTEVGAVFGKRHVSVQIQTHEIDIGKPGDPWPQDWPRKRVTSCTYSRTPCSLVDDVEISVDGKALFVARSVFADLADLTTAALSQRKNGTMMLTLDGGDGAESYNVELTFDKSAVRERKLMDRFDGKVMERSLYAAPRDRK